MKSRIFIICFLLIVIISGITPTIVNSEENATVEVTNSQNNLANSNHGELHAFYPSNGVFSSQVENYIDNVDSLSFAWSRMYANNPQELNITKGQNGNDGFYYPKDYAQVISYAKSKGKSIQLSVFMGGTDSTLLLPYDDKRNAAIKAIIDLLKKDISDGESIYYDGVVIDFESLRDTDNSKEIKIYEGKKISQHFVQFLNDIKVQLDIIGKKLYVAVNPKLYYDGYDYKAILGIADRMILMAHDYEPTEKLSKEQIQQYTGYDALYPINSIAPIEMVRRALKDIKNSNDNSSDLSKVWLQISFSIAQWRYTVPSADGWKSLNSSALSIHGRTVPLYNNIKERIDNIDGYGKNITYGYNNELQSPFIEYYNSSEKLWNVIIYEDSNSVSAKIELAKSFGIGGISVWSLANIPDYNDLISKKFHLDCWDTVLQNMNMPFTPVSLPISTTEGNSNIKFVDKFVEKAVRDRLKNSNGKISAKDLKGVYRLKLPVGVKNLADLKYLVNLEYLDAQQLGIKDVSVLGNLSKLRVLYLQRNQIADITPLKKLKLLQVISLNGNKIMSIQALSGLTELRKLYLKENKVVSLVPLSGLKNLELLNAGMNKIADLSPLSRLNNLQELSVDNNLLINTKGLGGMTKLRKLYLKGNKITNFDPLKPLFALVNFKCDFTLE